MSNVQYENRGCSYCGNRMKIAQSRIKRTVPQGAKDLGLSDEVICWSCPQCGQSTTEGIEVCNCGSLTLSKSGHAPAPDAHADETPHLQVKLFHLMSDESATGRGNEYRCTACLPCYECHKPLGTFDFVRDKEYDVIFRDESDYKHQPIIQTHYAFFHKSCLDRRKRLDAEKKSRQEEEYTRRLEEERKQKEQKQVEKERQRRINAGLCIVCGSSLGFTDKIAGRQQHKRC